MSERKKGFLIDVPGRDPLIVHFGTPIVQPFESEPVGKEAEYIDPEPDLKDAPAKVRIDKWKPPSQELEPRIPFSSLNRPTRRRVKAENQKNGYGFPF